MPVLVGEEEGPSTALPLSQLQFEGNVRTEREKEGKGEKEKEKKNGREGRI